MERGNLGRWLLIAAGVFLLMTFLPKLFGKHETVKGYLQPERELIANANSRPPEQLCDIWGPSFQAQLTTRGASLKHFKLTSAKYQKDGKPIDLSTSPDIEFRRQLRFDWRNAAAKVPDANWNVDADSFDWQLSKSTGKECEFSYTTDKVRLTKTITSTGRPYELKVDSNITNTSDRPLTHELTVHTDAWRTNHEVKGGMFTVSPLVTHVECVLDTGKATRVRIEDFEPDDFKNVEHFPKNELTRGDWYQVPGKPEFAAVSNAYFSHAVVPLRGPTPTCQLQIEERWDYRAHSKDSDPNAGAMYRARLAYPKRELQPNQTETYSLFTYVGPKERSVLAVAGGGKHQLTELIDLGFFSAIAKILVAFLLKVHGIIPNWGIAIIILTITARTLLFPLAVPSIKGMIKMRELKPEIDRLNEKFKDDAQAKGLAQMELWRKHNVNPLKGCLPQLASMPVWFALYTTLQTAVELYNIPFLWFPDLSAKDPLYILPFIIGGTSFIQQKLMPMQQGDPAQQKMMLYFMPAMFTVFMLFLPAGLGVYMFTNGVLGILQQQAVEWHVRRTVRTQGNADIKVKVIEESASPAARGGKGKGSSPPAKLAEDGPLLGKRKA